MKIDMSWEKNLRALIGFLTVLAVLAGIRFMNSKDASSASQNASSTPDQQISEDNMFKEFFEE